MDKISIKGLKIKTIIGTCKRERKRKQDILVDVEIMYNAQKARKTDAIKHAVDYEQIARQIRAEVSTSRFFLIERLADCVLQIATKDKRIKKAVVRACKPKALSFAESVCVELSKTQS